MRWVPAPVCEQYKTMHSKATILRMMSWLELLLYLTIGQNVAATSFRLDCSWWILRLQSVNCLQWCAWDNSCHKPQSTHSGPRFWFGDHSGNREVGWPGSLIIQWEWEYRTTNYLMAVTHSPDSHVAIVFFCELKRCLMLCYVEHPGCIRLLDICSKNISCCYSCQTIYFYL